MGPGAYEDVLRTRLLQRGTDGDVAARGELLALLCETRAAPLWRAAGRVLAAAVDDALVEAVADELAHGIPAWRFQPLAAVPAIRTALRKRLDDAQGRDRVAALRALAPVVAAADVRDAVLACLDDPAAQVCSTAIEVLRPIAAEPAVRDRLLAVFAERTRLPPAALRALRRSLRAAARDPRVQQELLAALRADRRRWIAAEALAGAPPNAALTAGLLAILARTRPSELVELWPAFVPLAHVPEVIQAFVPLLADPNPVVVQAALRVVGEGTSDAARAEVLAALDHDTNYVRWGAALQLASRVHEPAVRTALLARLTDDDDDGVRMIVAGILADALDEPLVRAALTARLADPSPAVAVAAAGALCRAEPSLVAWDVLHPHITGPCAPFVLYTRSWQPIRPLAVLGVLPTLPAVRDALAPLLTDANRDRRLAAIRALRASPPDPAIADHLAARITDDIPHVAGAAYETLATWVAAP
ncbi:MAG TPA: HEAT repeat domain-containing protein [Nannocystis sp.]